MISVIIPVYNEEEMLPVFHKMLCEAVEKLPYAFTIYYINDGSTDGTQAHLEQIAAGDSRVVGIELSRNFGHQAALTAGLDRAESDRVGNSRPQLPLASLVVAVSNSNRTTRGGV